MIWGPLAFERKGLPPPQAVPLLPPITRVCGEGGSSFGAASRRKLGRCWTAAAASCAEAATKPSPPAGLPGYLQMLGRQPCVDGDHHRDPGGLDYLPSKARCRTKGHGPRWSASRRRITPSRSGAVASSTTSRSPGAAVRRDQVGNPTKPLSRLAATRLANAPIQVRTGRPAQSASLAWCGRRCTGACPGTGRPAGGAPDSATGTRGANTSRSAADASRLAASCQMAHAAAGVSSSLAIAAHVFGPAAVRHPSVRMPRAGSRSCR